MKRLAILTGGGDAPGLNAVIRAAVKTAILEYGAEVLGILNGFDGFTDDNGIVPLDLSSVRGILPRGGTILGTANRGNPFAKKVFRDGEEIIIDYSEEVVEKIHSLDLSGLIVVGGDGTLHIAQELFELGVPVIGVPKTIDNDIGGTDFTFGFDTAVNTAMEAIDKLHTTAESHHRVMVLELMGRNAGFITLHAGLAGGADVILIPEIPFHFEAVCHKVMGRISQGSKFSIVAIAEGASLAGGEQVYAIAGDEIFTPRLGGIGQVLVNHINSTCKAESRLTVLGHLQRGGSPSPFDRWLSTNFGSEAIRLAMAGDFGNMVSLQGTNIKPVPLKKALSKPKRVDVNGVTVKTARAIGISLGDEI